MCKKYSCVKRTSTHPSSLRVSSPTLADIDTFEEDGSRDQPSLLFLIMISPISIPELPTSLRVFGVIPYANASTVGILVVRRQVSGFDSIPPPLGRNACLIALSNSKSSSRDGAREEDTARRVQGQ